MPTIQSDDRKRRAPHDPQTGKPGNENEPNIPGDPDDLNEDQADSGPDRDHTELG